MRFRLLDTLLSLSLVFACGAATALEDAVVDGCQACHQGALSLASREPAALRDRIAALATASAGSHPVPVPTLSDADLAALVARLTEQ